MKRKTYSTEEKKNLIDAALTAENVNAFCEQQGIAPSLFYRWKKELSGTKPKKSAAKKKFVKATVRVSAISKTATELTFGQLPALRDSLKAELENVTELIAAAKRAGFA